MAWFNRVLEEYGIHHKEYDVPVEVIASLEKKKDVAAKNVTMTAEAKKRKGGGATKAAAKKPRVESPSTHPPALVPILTLTRPLPSFRRVMLPILLVRFLLV